jgi:secondary thiamine-phosphate synthase enzyme
MRLASHLIAVQTSGPGLTDVTDHIAAFIREQGATEGVIHLLCRHTSASLTIQENADPDVQRDLEAAMSRLAPHDPRLYIHRAEGPDDMPAHIRTVLSGVTLSIPIARGRMTLGTWQGIYLWEHRDHPHRREIALSLMIA